MSSVYLAGPISGLTHDDAAGSWRAEAIKRLTANHITALSPMRAKTFLRKEGILVSEHPNHPLSTAKGIVTRDRWDCQRADVVLVNLCGATSVSIGTMIELGWADSARRPIVLAIEKGNIHWHGMVTELAGFILPTFEEALSLTIGLLKG